MRILPDGTVLGGMDVEDVPEDGRLIGAAPEPGREQPAAPVARLEKVVDWSAVPEVQVLTAAAAEEARVQTEVRRWRDALRVLRTLALVIAAVVTAVLGYELVHRVFNALPSDARLAKTGDAIGAVQLATWNTPERPLALAAVEPRLVSRGGARRADYVFQVTLRLREPLYGPADSNGAQAYLDLQRAVADAHAVVVRERLFVSYPALGTPVAMPALIAVAHRAGERLVVEVPVSAVRGLWGWSLEPATEAPARRVMSPTFSGEVLERQPWPHLVFGRAETRETMRTLVRHARDYVLAVQAALAEQRRNSGPVATPP